MSSVFDKSELYNGAEDVRIRDKIWKCKDGKEIAIKDMTDSHLQNTIALIERTAEKQEQELSVTNCPFQGEMATMDFDRMQLDVLENGVCPSEICSQYDDLIEEQLNRKEVAS